jgi:eukaryotic-like serine/threonine-protein kinase
MAAPDDGTRPLRPPAGDETVVVAPISPELSPATDDLRVLLRKRLLFFAALMAASYAVVLVMLAVTALTVDRGFSLLAVVSLGVCGGLGLVLWRWRRLSVRGLRAFELALFGAVYLQWVVVHGFLFPGLRLPDPPDWFGFIFAYAVSFPWALLIIGYGVLIPNTWRRCAAVVGVMAVTPLVVAKWNGMAAQATGQFPEVNYFVLSATLMGMSAALAVYASYRIETLRRAAVVARQLGPYTLVRLLGAGGMGEVYLAQHRLLKRPCAVKLIRPEKAEHAATVRRFEREVEAAARLTHPAAVQVYDYGREPDGTFYYVMEYLPGLTLGEVVRRTGPLPAGRVIHILRPVCAALAEAHALGLVHRDIKPANVMVCPLGGRGDVAKLLDFGLVADVNRADATLTQDGAVLGTPHYLSPEQARGEVVGPAGDLYSLGATAYFLLTGRPPFTGPNTFALLHAHQTEAVSPPSRVRPDVPADLEAVVLTLLAKEPAERYSATAADAALAACSAAGTWTDTHAADWWAAVGGSPDTPNAAPTVTATGGY